MTGLLWSVALAAIGITGLWLAGSGRRGGWALGLSAQLLWIVYALATAQYGFIAFALAYGFVYARNWRRARPPKPAPITFQPKCRVPPPGWWCSRDAGHEGPCAARPFPVSTP